jgi:hypothetical protein
MSVRFIENRRGGLTVDRDSLHESEGYKRQVEALKQLPERKSVMGEKMTLEQAHRLVRGLMRVHPKGMLVRDAWETLERHLTQPAQAVDVGAVVEAIASEWDGCEYESVGGNIDIGAAIRRKARALTAALPNANGKEG